MWLWVEGEWGWVGVGPVFLVGGMMKEAMGWVATGGVIIKILRLSRKTNQGMLTRKWGLGGDAARSCIVYAVP